MSDIEDNTMPVEGGQVEEVPDVESVQESLTEIVDAPSAESFVEVPDTVQTFPDEQTDSLLDLAESDVAPTPEEDVSLSIGESYVGISPEEIKEDLEPFEPPATPESVEQVEETNVEVEVEIESESVEEVSEIAVDEEEGVVLSAESTEISEAIVEPEEELIEETSADDLALESATEPDEDQNVAPDVEMGTPGKSEDSEPEIDVEGESEEECEAEPDTVSLVTPVVVPAQVPVERAAPEQAPLKVTADPPVKQQKNYERTIKVQKRKSPEKVHQSIPETLLKKQLKEERINASRAVAKVKASEDMAKKRQGIFKRAQLYEKEYEVKERDQIRLRRMAKREGNFYVPAEAKLAFVIRIRGINQVSPKVKKALQLLRLRQINNGVFVKLNKSTINMLRLVEPYIAWGYPNLKSVRHLVYKRGFAKLNHQRVPINENRIIEKSLSSCNIICMEDLVHEIFSVGENFKVVNNFLWPFKLNCPTGGMRKKTNHFVEGGDHGNREEFINKLIGQMM